MYAISLCVFPFSPPPHSHYTVAHVRFRVAVTASGERRALTPSDEREIAKIEAAKRELEEQERKRKALEAASLPPPSVLPPPPIPPSASTDDASSSQADKKDKKKKVCVP